MRTTYRRPARARRRAWAIVLLAALVVTIASILVVTQVGASRPAERPQGAPVSSFGAADGFIPTGEPLSPFDDASPALAGLDPALRGAMQAAAADAIADGVDFVVTSGWRSAPYQQALFDEAVSDYGSVEEARRHVATADTSAHVTGNAVDIGFTDANSWLSQHGADYGLCQTFANEMWHYELATTPGGECPPQLPDASYAAGW